MHSLENKILTHKLQQGDSDNSWISYQIST